jgi:rhodanese-related sulfurtransferase
MKKRDWILWWVPFGSVPELEARELAERCRSDEPPQLVDVRTKREWNRSRIPNAVHVPIGSLRKRVDGLGLDPQRPVVAICLSAHRSIPAVRLFRKRDFAEVYQLKGGMKAWWAADLRTQSS